jgi:hypothetical protein
MPADPDPRGLIGESFRLADLSGAECRSIFLDWALGLPEDADVPALARRMLALPEARPDHPMHAVLLAASAPPHPPSRRGGRSRTTAKRDRTGI